MDEATVDRLRAHAEERLVAIPDTDGEVQAALGRLDELLGLIWQWEQEEPDHGTGLRLATEAAHHAVGRISAAVRRAEAEVPAQPVAPDGRYELVPVAWATMARADLVELGLAVQALGRASGLGADQLVRDALVEVGGYEAGRRPEDLVAEAARLHGLLWLPWDGRVARVAAVLPAGAGRVVLDEATHAAYQELVDRVLGIWHAGDHLAPFLYRGQQ
jgi:hypothetical protein